MKKFKISGAKNHRKNLHKHPGPPFQIRPGPGSFSNAENSATLSIELNAKNHVGQTALHLACRFGHFDVAKMLIENSASLSIDLNAIDTMGMTAYNYGLASGSKDTMKLMLNNEDTLKNET